MKDPHLFITSFRDLTEYGILHYSKQVKCNGENTKDAHSLRFVIYHPEIHRTEGKTDNLKTIKDTRKIHSIQNTGVSGVLEKRNTLCCCTTCMHGIGECQFKGYADKWEMCSVVRHRKAELKQFTNELYSEYHMKVSSEARNGAKKYEKSDGKVMKTSPMESRSAENVMKSGENVMKTDVLVLRRSNRVKCDEKVMNYNKDFVNLDSSGDDVMKTDVPVMKTAPSVMHSDDKVMKTEGPVMKTASRVMHSDDKVMKTTPLNTQVDWIAIFRDLEHCTSYNDLKSEVLRKWNETYLQFCTSNHHLEIGPQDKIDLVAENFYPQDRPKCVFPIYTYGDGNCFPRSLSKIMSGTEGNHLEMHFRIILEGIRHEEDLIDSRKLSGGCKEINYKLSMQYVMYSGVNYAGS